MGRTDPLRHLRSSRFEQFEPRMMMSAQSPVQEVLQADDDHPLQEMVTTGPTASSYDSFEGIANVRSAYNFTGAGQTIAVIDSGIAYDHAALGGGFGANYKVVGGWDFAENDANPYDDGPMGSHGTHVAGIAASSDVNNPGVASGADLVALRVFDDAGNGNFAWVDQALKWVHNNRNSFRNPITAVNLSLGADWNASTVPNWAMLENDFAQLKADGIFIAVAAGNSFGTYNAPGLSYPGASSYVVPVEAFDTSGSLASYSQRLDRAIAAPGTGIRSTVPDYVGNLNGRTDDWASYSGTSMATPYVAAASTLIRQAMQYAGCQNINEDSINAVMRNTADSIYDAATHQSYLRLNVQHAIDSVMGVDDYGSTAGTANNLGTLLNSTTLNGAINRVDDKDFFTFTAGMTGTVTFNATPTGGMASRWEVVGTAGVVNNNSLTLNIVAGQSYTVGLSSSAGLGHYRLDITTSITTTPWGAVDFKQVAGLNLANADNWYTVTATHNGIFTVQAIFAQAGGNVQIELYNSSNQLLGSGNAASYGQRLDANAFAGQTYFVHVRGTNASVDFKLMNLVTPDGVSVTVAGTAGDDAFTFAASASPQVTINGINYQFSAAVVSRFVFNGGAGNDTLTLTGTAGNETATLRPGTVEFAGAGFAVGGTGVERITVNGNGGSDHADLWDSIGNDTLDSTPTNSRLYGSGFDNTVQNFNDIFAHSAAGGSDSANFYDSAGNDTFYGLPGSAVMFGAGYHNLETGFITVNAYSNAGGHDVGHLFDSAGDDWFLATPTWARMLVGGYYTQTNNFEKNYAYATAGYDKAYLYDGMGDDTYIGFVGSASLSGAGYANYALAFDLVSGNASAGLDKAYVYDSAGDDTFYSTPTWSAMYGNGFYNHINNFRNVWAISQSGGHDTASMYDSNGNDTFTADRNSGYMTNGTYNNTALGFSSIYAYGMAGGTDDATVRTVDYLFSLMGRWRQTRI